MIKRNIKMVVTSEESQQVQEICFVNGIGWWKNCKELEHIDKPHLVIIGDRLHFNYGNRYSDYRAYKYEEVDASLFIKTKGSCIEENQEQELKQNIEEEQMKDTEVETYKDVTEYLVAKGLYDRVMNIEWEELDEYESFSALYIWMDTKEGASYWSKVDKELRDLDIHMNIESLVQDYKAKQGKVEETPKQSTNIKPKQYLCYVQGKALPKHIHKTLEQAKQEAQRLCRKELTEVMVLEVVSKYQAKVIVEEV